jgi:hypothetical protein
MDPSRFQFSIGELLLAIALFSSAIFLGIHLSLSSYAALEILLCAMLFGGSFGILTHRFWRGVILGLLAVAIPVLLGLLDLAIVNILHRR